MATLKVAKPLAAFLDLIAASEGTSSNPLTKADGYDVIVSGVDGHHVFTDFATHPFALGRPPILVREAEPEQVKTLPIGSDSKPQIVAPAVPALHSTASGRYQIILPTWKHLAGTYTLGTFSPQNQDLAALHLLDECDATRHILNGDVEVGISRACETWASFPGNLYNQRMHTMESLLTTYNKFLLLTGKQGA